METLIMYINLLLVRALSLINKFLKNIFIGSIGLFFVCPAFAEEWQNDAAIKQLFENESVVGTFVVYDVTANQFIGYNHERAKERFIPASTFKIPNSLIGLDMGAVKDVDEVFPYDGKPKYLKPWEKDMGLREAMKVSNVPVYQELARRITLARMQEGIKKLNYGNAIIGGKVDMFWLEGPLKISAIEQTEFLAKLAQNILPISQNAQNAVQEITLLEKKENWELHGKTGTIMRSDEKIGWWVGWVKKGDKVYSFALNLDNNPRNGLKTMDPLSMEQRINLGKASLDLLGIME